MKGTLPRLVIMALALAFTLMSHAAEEITLTLPGGVTMVLIKIPAGSFQMGSPDTERGHTVMEGPVHTVTFSKPFYLGKTEVTQAQWQAVMGVAMPTSCGSWGVGPDHPVYCVSWKNIADPTNAGSFLKKLDAILTATDQPGAGLFRLPSEAEWEYAARGNTATRFSFGDNLDCDDECGACTLADQYMWWCENSTILEAKPVGTKLPNPFGLYDMHGNLLEWIQDAWHNDYTGAPTDGSAWESGGGSFSVVRGGNWDGIARYCRSADRYGPASSGSGPLVGFRLAATYPLQTCACRADVNCDGVVNIVDMIKVQRVILGMDPCI
jgi:formylglycine-generating enzyme required for sulfatase activity